MKNLLLILPALLFISCAKDIDFAGTYKGDVNVKHYNSIIDFDLTGEFMETNEIVYFTIHNDENGDYFVWESPLIVQGSRYPSSFPPVYLNRRGKGKFSFNFSDVNQPEWVIEIKIDINDYGIMRYEAQVIEMMDANGNGRSGIVVYDGELLAQ